MGKSITPKYRVVFLDGRSTNVQAWRGRATTATLEKWVFSYAKSLELTGVNGHISKALGYIPYPVQAWIVRQKDNEAVAFWQAGQFQVY